MKFQIEVRDERGGPWWETFDEEECKDEASIKAWVERTIARYNDTLRPHESPRTFVGGIKIVGDGTRQHKWTKLNVFTQDDKARGAYDKLRCTQCGAIARRYGVDHIKMQKGYTAKKWRSCPGVVASTSTATNRK